MSLYFCLIVISFSLYSGESTRISQLSPVTEDREGDLRRTLMYCKSVTVFLHPNEDKKDPHSNVNDFSIVGRPLEATGQKVKNSYSLDGPPYIGGYLSSFEAPVNNLGSKFVNVISNEYLPFYMVDNVVESDSRSVEDPLEGLGYPDEADLDTVDIIDHSGLKIKPVGRSSKLRDACISACCNAVTDTCDECDCSSGLKHEFRKNCKSACKSEF